MRYTPKPYMPGPNILRNLYINLGGKVTECFIEEFLIKLDKIVCINGICDITNALKCLKISTASKEYKEMMFEHHSYVDLYDNPCDCYAKNGNSYLSLSDNEIALKDLGKERLTGHHLINVSFSYFFWQDISNRLFKIRIGKKREKLVSYTMSSLAKPVATSKLAEHSYYDMISNKIKFDILTAPYFDSEKLCTHYAEEEELQKRINAIPIERFSREEKEEQIIKRKRNHV